jgi:hypothetical protein
MNICQYCNKEASYQFKNGIFCCSKNVSGCSEIQNRKEKKCLEKYGDKNYKNTKKAKQTKLKNYGDENYNNRDLAIDTIVKSHGVNNVSKIDSVKQKKDATFDKNFRQNEKKLTDLANRRSATWLNNDVDAIINKSKITYLEKYGVDNPQKVATIKKQSVDKWKITISQRSVEENNKIINKYIKTRTANGNMTPRDMLSEYKKYHKLVWTITRKQELSSLPNIEKRSSDYANNEECYHLDHKYSIAQGFIDNVDAKIIGHIKNLEMIHFRKNMSKNMKCSISLEELQQLIESIDA